MTKRSPPDAFSGVQGDPPTIRCTPEGLNAGADEAARLGVKAIEAGKAKNTIRHKRSFNAPLSLRQLLRRNAISQQARVKWVFNPIEPVER